MAVAKGYLSKVFINSMEALNAQHTWRSSFQDQLQINYKDWLIKKVQDEFFKGNKVEDFIGGEQGILGQQLKALEDTKEPIKRSIESSIANKHRIREIESESLRTVHFLFDPKCNPKVTPFTKKYQRMIDGSLAQFENEEKDKFDAYI